MKTSLPFADSQTAQRFKIFFLVAALYDIVLGVVFFFLFDPLFRALNIPLPNNLSYLHLTAAWVFSQGVAYWFVSRELARNIDLVKVGIIYKAIYVLTAAYYVAIGQLLNAIFAWFAVGDAIFVVGFAWFLLAARQLSERKA